MFTLICIELNILFASFEHENDMLTWIHHVKLDMWFTCHPWSLT